MKVERAVWKNSAVAPGGVLSLQQVTCPAVVLMADRGVEHEPRKQPKHLLAHSHLALGGSSRGECISTEAPLPDGGYTSPLSICGMESPGNLGRGRSAGTCTA